jgi:tetratricopeptide (TPR) repeat protein
MNYRVPLILILAASGLRAAVPPPASAPTQSVAVATASAPAGCVAVLTVDGKEMELQLVRHTGDQLYFRVPNAPAGALSAIRFDTVQAAEFKGEVDAYSVFEATRARRWKDAADLILARITPCLPFLDLPKNNAAAAASEAGLYLYRAAGAARAADGALTPAAKALYEQSTQVFGMVAEAEWYNGRDQAKLRAALCQTASGRLDEADKWLKSARLPDPGDGDYGLHAFAQAALLLAGGKTLEACNAAARSTAFENKDPQVFPDALLLEAHCYEELMDYYRARDIYFEVARLFGATEWGEQALARLTFIMDNKLTEEKEKTNIAKVFFGSEEDMNVVVTDFLKTKKTEKK